MENLIYIQEKGGVHVVESRDIATELNIQHKNFIETIRNYQSEIESTFGRVAFETAPLQTAGGLQASTIAYLTEDQAIFIATLSRNSEQVVKFKARLVQAFQAARKFIAPMNPAEMKLQVFKMLEQEAESLKVQLQLANSTIKAQAPKVEYCDKVLDSVGAIATTVIASEFGKSAQVLHKELKDKGVMWRVNGVWVLTAKYSGKGYTITKTHAYTDSLGQQKTSIQTYWTEKGRHFLHKIFDQPKAA